MESAGSFVCTLAGSSLWLLASGFVLWLGLRNRWQLSPGTRAAASVLILLQGWMLFVIPVGLDLSWIDPQVQEFAIPDTAAMIAWTFSAPEPPAMRRFSSTNYTMSLGRPAGLVVLALWMAGMLIILRRSITGIRSLVRITRTLPSAPAEWQCEMTEICRAMSITRTIELKISPVATPMLLQTWRFAWVVIPGWLWESSTPEQRTAILRHELAHYRRRDPWRRLAVHLLALPHWFNPMAWWAARQFESANEEACDDIACDGDPFRALEYTKVLLLLNERLGRHYAQALAVTGGSLTERIRRVLQPEFRKESRMSKLMMLSAMIVLTGLATIRIQAADPAPAENKTAPAPPVSLVPNGGFEELQTSGDPKSWFGTRLPRTAGHVDLSVSKSPTHGGERCVAVKIGDKHPAERVDYNWMIDAQGWQAGETYELSAWIKVDSANRPAVIMTQFLDEPRKQLLGGASTEQASPIQGTKDWTKVSTRFVVPTGTTVVRIRAGLSSKDNPGAQAWFDDVSLVKVSP